MQRESTIQPSRLTIDYPDRELNRLTTFFRLFAAIPILIVLGTVAEACGSGATTMGKKQQRPREECSSSAHC